MGQYQTLKIHQYQTIERPVLRAYQPLTAHYSGSYGQERIPNMYSKLSRQKPSRPWNKGKLMGQKSPLTPQEIWTIRIRLQNEGRRRDLALFNLAIDSKLRASDLLKIRVADIASNGQAQSRAMVSQQKTRQPVRFEITERTRKSIDRGWKTGFARLPLSQSATHLASLIDTPIFANRRILGFRHWSGFDGLRHAHHAPNQGNADLSPHKKP